MGVMFWCLGPSGPSDTFEMIMIHDDTLYMLKNQW